VAVAWAFDAHQVFISAFTDAEPEWHCVVSSSCPPPGTNTKSPCALLGLGHGTGRLRRRLSRSGHSIAPVRRSSFFAGCLAGGFLLTTLAESVLGRKKTLVVSLASMSVAGALTAFAPNVYAYAALRFLAGLARSVIVT
jgi:hypothetical protein